MPRSSRSVTLVLLGSPRSSPAARARPTTSMREWTWRTSSGASRTTTTVVLPRRRLALLPGPRSSSRCPSAAGGAEAPETAAARSAPGDGQGRVRLDGPLGEFLTCAGSASSPATTGGALSSPRASSSTPPTRRTGMRGRTTPSPPRKSTRSNGRRTASMRCAWRPSSMSSRRISSDSSTSRPRSGRMSRRAGRWTSTTIYGRFDLAFDGKGPPKLLEYNADTPTALLEAAVIQWSWLKDQVRDGRFDGRHSRPVRQHPRAPDGGAGAPRKGRVGAVVHFASMTAERASKTSSRRATCATPPSQAGLRREADRRRATSAGTRAAVFVDLAERADPRRRSSCIRGSGWSASRSAGSCPSLRHAGWNPPGRWS